MAKSRKNLTGKAVKHLNKRLNKLARKGKLKSKTKLELRRIQAAKMKPQTSVEQDWQETLEKKEEEEDLLDMVDPELRHVQDVSSNFLQRTLTVADQPTNKRAKLEELEEEPRVFSHEDVGRIKHLLPVKNFSGQIVLRSEKVKEELSDGEDEEQMDQLVEEKEEEEQPLPSAAQFYAQRQKLLIKYKSIIANNCHSVLQFPQEQISKLKEVLELMAGGVESVVELTVQKLATASLLEVFVDIVPGYQIRERTEEEKKQKMKKETKGLVEFEESLLKSYGKYIQQLEKQTKKAWIKREEPDAMTMLAVKSLCRLLTAHPGFNLRDVLVQNICSLATCGKSEVVETVCEALTELFGEDKLGDVSLDVVKCISKLVKDKANFPGAAQLLQTLLALRIKTVKKKGDEEEKKQKLKKRKAKMMKNTVSKKERKYRKHLEELERELRETEAETNRDEQLKLHTGIMEQVFSMYFRVLRRHAQTELLAPVLEGLAKFAHLINIDFFDDLIGSLRELIEKGTLKPLESLHAVHTVFVILSGEGSALNIDPQRFYRAVYALLPRIATEENSTFRLKQMGVSLKCLDLMIRQRRKQVSLSRVAAFVKRLCLLGLLLPTPFLRAVLAAVRSFFVAHPGLERLLDEEVVGSARFAPDVDDPDHCNALSTHLPELALCQKHADEVVRKLSAHIANGLPSVGNYRLPPSLTQKDPWTFLSEPTDTTDDAVFTGLSKDSKSKRNGLVCKEIAIFVARNTGKL